ncbi:MAG TPA: glycosyltransferase family 4 protein [Longimicrobium sp.]|nr:glycosyltransferase family 4 protein [Longimicrobium sp.]
MTEGPGMHIGYLSQYFHPEIAAPAARIEELGRVWLARGHRVSVLTGFPNYPRGEVFPGYRGRRFMRESWNGFEVTRVPLFATPRHGSVPTALSHLSFALAAAGASFLRGAPRPDVWIATSPPLFVGVGGVALRRAQRVPLVFEVRDLWPDYFRDLGMLRPGPTLSALYRMERHFYRSADAVVTIADAAVENVVGKGIERGKVFSVPGGAEVRSLPRRTAEERAAARARFGVRADAFVVGYLGTHGRCQRLHVLGGAVRELAGEGVQFLFVGDGAGKPLLEDAVRAEPTGAVLLPGQPREALAELYAVCDLLLVPLGDFPVISRTIPSKLFEIMGYGRPFVALVRGGAAAIAAASGGGEVVEPEDTRGLVSAVRRLRRRGAAGLERMGERGREYLRTHYTRERMALRYLEILQRLVSGPR